jgi:SAM-dependent methyltransferase
LAAVTAHRVKSHQKEIVKHKLKHNNMKPEELKIVVQEKYSDIAHQSKMQNQSSCCGSTYGCGESDYSVFNDDYTTLKGYNPDADLGLGCGLPTEYANIKPGNYVLDLGSGAGNDCFIARSLTGESGKVIGIDFTDAMIDKSRANNKKMGFTNVEFVKGDIENIPLPENNFDVVISNCVLNLVPNKQKAFSEIYRVIKPGAHFCVSDVVLNGNLPETLQKDAEMYAGCVSGAIQTSEYIALIEKSGFISVEIKKQKVIHIPDEILLKYMSREELKTYHESDTGIYSITVTGIKSDTVS